MSVPHGAPFANGAIPIYASEGIGEGIGASGESFEPFEYIGERLAVLAVAARIMERRHPRDVYAHTIARESERLALAVRAAHRATRIVDAAPDAPPDTAPDGEHDARELCSFPGCCHWYNDPCADCLEVERRQTPPDAGSLAGDGTQRTPAAQVAPRHRSKGGKAARHA